MQTNADLFQITSNNILTLKPSALLETADLCASAKRTMGTGVPGPHGSWLAFTEGR